jgi:hypothetical protein
MSTEFSSGSRRCCGVLANRFGTFTAEELVKSRSVNSPQYVFSRRDFPVPEHFIADYPDDADLRKVLAKHIASTAQWLYEMAKKHPQERRYERCARNIVKLTPLLIHLNDSNPAFARCCWAWLEPTLGCDAFLKRRAIQTMNVRAEVFKWGELEENDDIEEFLNSLARRLTTARYRA